MTVIYPGQIQTDISKKAVTGLNKTYGREEEFIEDGMVVGNAVKEMLVAIHKGEIEYVCSHETWHHWMAMYRNATWWTEDTEATNDYRRTAVFTKKDD